MVGAALSAVDIVAYTHLHYYMASHLFYANPELLGVFAMYEF